MWRVWRKWRKWSLWGSEKFAILAKRADNHPHPTPPQPRIQSPARSWFPLPCEGRGPGGEVRFTSHRA
jgi:hypothetical protein